MIGCSGLVVSTGTGDCLERLVSEVTYNVLLMGTLKCYNYGECDMFCGTRGQLTGLALYCFQL